MILHMCARRDWEVAKPGGQYRTDSLDTEGFVHCSDPGTVHLPATRLFRGHQNLVLLVVDPGHLTVPVRWEPGDGDPSGPWFPHVYGPITVDAVVAVHDFPPRPDGSFEPPAQLVAAGGPAISAD